MKIHVFDNRHISNSIGNVEKGDTIVLIDRLSHKRWSKYFKYNNIDEESLDINYVTQEEFFNMPGTEDNKKFPFNVGLMNSPYSNGDFLLYPPFFEKLLTLVEIGKVVMPVDLNSQQVRVKAHNKRVKKHMIDMSDNVTDQFGVGIPDIRYITASMTVENEVEDYVDPLNSHPNLHPARKRLSPRRGVGGFSRKSNQDPNGVDVMISIYRGNKIQWVKVNKDLVSKVKTSLISSAPYFVLVAENPSKGLFNTTIVKNDGTKWGSGIFGLDASSKEEAEKLEQWVVSKEMQAEVQRMLTLKNTHTFSGPMMEKLPWYE
jgi:hypothetical protein